MQGMKRRVTYVFFYEVLSFLICAMILAVLSGSTISHTGPLSLLIAVIAVSVNFFYNYAFEWWEKRQHSKTRTIFRRVVHAIGFQVVLVIILIPLIAWWMQISLVKAFLLDFSLMIIIPCYTFVYNYFFDHLFGLPSHLLETKPLPSTTKL
ncbi:MULTISPECIES: PACE efflux transporter [Acinetobacter]|uniref:PACE efflux transporter n=1 Tax=Acinetobacter TaxID=469 RepID=UPI000B3BE8E7|nr:MULTISPECIES: PACE efflux transporter [Acinetobacter]AWA46674.1 PACE efflux transporter [Acinetobacter junii]MDI6622583.1 PACE efflux transporter [Acinetobacter junii]RTE46223.1 PACE efflux transporter [Acinetobacter junii]